MNKILRKLYKIYINDVNLEHYITNQKNYQSANKKISKLESKYLSKMKKTEYYDLSKKFVEDYFYAYVELSDIYRYHDFEQGILIGFILSSMLTPNISNELLDRMINVFE